MSDDRGIWYLPSPSGEGGFVVNAHPGADCSGRGCPLHAPSDHWAGGMPLRWDVGRMERLCPHGLWHDDPDDLEYRRSAGMPLPRREETHHCGCRCGCPVDVPF